MYKKSLKKLDKSMILEALVFSQAQTNTVSRPVTRRRYILSKVNVTKLCETLSALRVNYGHNSPIAFHDVAVIHQIRNDISSLVM